MTEPVTFHTSTESKRPKRPVRREAWPRGLRRNDAADYVGISPTLFDTWVSAGKLPKSARIGGIVLWDRFALDNCMEAIFYAEEDADLSIWDDVRA